MGRKPGRETTARARPGAHPLTGEARQIERLARRIVAVLRGRVTDGFDAAQAVAITDEDRLRVLRVFVARLAVSDPAALAQIRRALDAPCSGASITTQGSTIAGARHEGR